MTAARPTVWNHRIAASARSWWSHPRWRWLILSLAILGGGRALLPWVLEAAINQRLDRVPGYQGQVEDVDLELWRGAYQLEGLTLLKSSETINQPLLEAALIDFSIAWRDLFRGRIHSDIRVQNAKLTFVQGETQKETQTPTDNRWQSVIEDLFPIEITHLAITQSELRLINREAGDLPYDIRLSKLQLVAQNLRNRPTRPEELTAEIHLTSMTDGGGRLELNGRGNPLAAQPHFDLNLQLQHVALPKLNDFLRAYAGVDVRAGSLSIYAEMSAAEGQFQGYLKPFLENIDFTDTEMQRKPLLDKLWESTVSFLAFVFKNHARNQIGTRVPFSGEFDDTQVETLATVAGLLRHAFIKAFNERLDNTIDNETLVRTQPANAPPAESP